MQMDVNLCNGYGVTLNKQHVKIDLCCRFYQKYLKKDQLGILIFLLNSIDTSHPSCIFIGFVRIRKDVLYDS